MKINRFILLLIAAAALTGCGKEHIESNGGPDAERAIAFATKLSRASAINTEVLLAEKGGFDVWAITHTAKWTPVTVGTPLLDGVTVTSPDKKGIEWIYPGPVEWPAGRYVSFFACGPAGAADFEPSCEGETPEIRFTVADSVSEQIDLLVASTAYDRLGPDGGDSRAVNLQFGHALSRVRFSAILDAAMPVGEQVRVKSVTLSGLYGSGSALLANDSSSPIVWNPGVTKKNYTVSLGNGLSDVTLSTISQEITPNEGMLFLLPQTIQRADPPMMTVILSIKKPGDEQEGETTYSVQLFSPAAWQPGKSYDYQILVGTDGIKAIVIDTNTTLDPWASSVIIQSVIMSGKGQADDQAGFYNGLKNLNYLKGSAIANAYPWFKYKWFGLYATRDINNDISIDLTTDDARNTLVNNFEEGDHLIFDFKKVVDVWKQNAGTAYKVEVKYLTTEWKLSAAMQTPDGYTGATIPGWLKKADNQNDSTYMTIANLSSAIRARGAIILERLEKITTP